MIKEAYEGSDITIGIELGGEESYDIWLPFTYGIDSEPI